MFAVHQTINGINHLRQIILFCIVTSNSVMLLVILIECCLCLYILAMIKHMLVNSYKQKVLNGIGMTNEF